MISTTYPPRGPDHGGGTSRKAWLTRRRDRSGLMTIACDSKIEAGPGFVFTCTTRLALPGARTAEQARDQARAHGWATQLVDERLRDHCPIHVIPEPLRVPLEPR